MNKQEKQDEIKKITSVCEENGIEYDINKLNFIEQDTGNYIDINMYTLLVIKEEETLKLYGFYSVNQVCCFQIIQRDQAMEVLRLNDKELAGFIFIDNKNNLSIFVNFYITHEYLNNKDPIDPTQPSTSYDISNEMYLIYMFYQKEKKYMFFNYLKEHQYLIDKIIDGKPVMHLDMKDKSLDNFILDACSIINTRHNYTRTLINILGFNIINDQNPCIIPVDTNTFKKYYLPFIKISLIGKDDKYRNNILTELYNFYNNPIPKDSVENLALRNKVGLSSRKDYLRYIELLLLHSQYLIENR